MRRLSARMLYGTVLREIALSDLNASLRSSLICRCTHRSNIRKGCVRLEILLIELVLLFEQRDLIVWVA